MIDDRILQKLLNEVLKEGGEYADIFVEKKYSFSAQVEDGKVEKVINGIDAGVGIRLIYNWKTFYGYINSFDYKDLLEIAFLIRKCAHESPSREIKNIALKKIFPLINHPYKLHPDKVLIDNKIKFILNADKTARSYSDKVKQVTAIYHEDIQDVWIATSEGNFANDHRIYTFAVVQAVASDNGIIQTGYETLGGLVGFEIFEENPVEQIALYAASRAVMMLNAQKAPAGRMPVIISKEAGGTIIHEAIGHGLEADLSTEGLSVYSDKIGQKVASEAVTIVDDATLKNKRGSFCFDDEATPAQRTVLIEKGILVGYIYDKFYGMKNNKSSTGNGRRQSYKHCPIPRMTNTFLAPGNYSDKDIISSVEKGLFVKKMGGGQVNTINGDFVFEVQEGYLIEHGEIGEPVRGATIIGNGLEVIKSIEMVGNEIGFSIGTCGKDGQSVPVSDATATIKIPNMVVGGKIL